MEQEVVLDVKVKNQGLKQQLREAVKEAQALQERFGATSTEAINAAKKVANIKEQISDMNDVFKAFNPEQKFNALIGVTQGIAGGFQAVTGAMGLFGAETKDVEKALLKVQSATAFAEGLNNIRGLGDSFKNLKLMVMDGIKSLGTLRGALIASGIGIFAVAVGAIVTNWKELKAWIDKTFPSLAGIGDMFDKIKKVAFGTLSSIVEGFKIVGEVIGNVFTGEFSKAVEVAGTFGQRVSQAYTKGYKEEEQKLADERTAIKLEALNKEHARTLKVLEAQGKDTYAFKRKLLNDELELLRLQNKKETDEYKDKLTEIRVLDAEHKKKIDEANAKRAADLAAAKKTIADTNQKDLEGAEQEMLKLEETLNKITDSHLEKQAKDLESAYNQRKSNEEKIKKDQEQFAADELKREKEKEEAKRAIQNEAFAISKQALDSMGTILDMNKQKELESAKGNKEKIAAIEKKYFERNKKLQIAQATMATAQAAVQAYQSMVGIPVAGPALAVVAAAAAVAAGAVQIAKIKSTKFEGGGDSGVSATTTPTPSANTTAGGVTGMQAPQQVGQGIANANAINNALNNPNMIRAVVVETDITDSQRRVRGIEDRATFG